MDGNPVAAFVACTRVPSASFGYALAGGGVPFAIQSTIAAVSALSVSDSGFGLAGSTHAPPRPRAAAGRRRIEAARAASVRRAREIISADIFGQRNVFRGGRAHQIGRHAQIPEFRRTESLENLRASVRGAAAIEQTRALAPANRILPIAPPEDRVAAGLVGIGRAIGQREAQIERQLPAGDMRHRAVPHDFSGFILVETEIDERPNVISRLRGALAYDGRIFFRPADWALPESSLFACRKNETRSRVAAKPMPSTSGSFAVKTIS